MSSPKVYNKRRPFEIPNGAVYVGRPTQWGNPFSKGSKSENIANFQEYAEKRKKQQPGWLNPLKGKDLVCWCSPEGCHADVLVQMANEPKMDWDAWAEANCPEDVMLDKPSDWEVLHGLA